MNVNAPILVSRWPDLARDAENLVAMSADEDLDVVGSRSTTVVYVKSSAVQ